MVKQPRQGGTAQRLLRDGLGAVDKGTLPSGRVSFEDGKKAVLLEYKTNKRRSADDIKGRIENHLEPVFKGWQLADIATIKIREYQAQRQDEDASNATINRECDAISKMFTLMIEDRKLFARPVVPKLEESAPRKGFVTDAEFKAISEKLEPHMQGIWAFLFLTGWRISEVLALRWERVGRKYIRFTGQTKGDEAARPFPIHPGD